MLTHSFTRTWSSSGSAISKTVSVDGGGEINIDETIPVSQTDRLVAFTCAVGRLKGFFMVADGDLLVETNDGDAPANTFTLLAGTPFLWVSGDPAVTDTAGIALADINALYVTNESATAEVLLQIRSLTDPTP